MGTVVVSRNVGDQELETLADRVSSADPVAGADLRAALTAAGAPVRIQVAGRAGVGRSTTVAALQARSLPGVVVEEADAVDVPDAPDPSIDGEVLVYVLVESVRAADREAVRALEPARALFVLNKADALGEPRAQGAFPIAVTARAAECAEEGGLPTLPLIGSLAIARAPSEPDLAILRRAPEELRPVWDDYGLACAVQACAADPTLNASGLAAVLRAASGIDAVSEAVAERVERARLRRGGNLVRALRGLAARSVAARDVLEVYLAGDEAVSKSAAAARAELVDWDEQAPGPPQTPEAALLCAAWWKSRPSDGSTLRQRQGVLDIRRHYLRIWARGRTDREVRPTVELRRP